MSKILPVLLLSVLLATPAFAELKTRVVQYQEGDTVMEGYLAYDDRFTGKRPGVLVVHEWWGLNDYIKSRTNQLAGLGYIAFAADIYGKGVRAEDVKQAGELATKYKQDRALYRTRLKAAYDTLKEQTSVDPKRLAVIGYCFGGTGALELARSGADLKAVVTFHGGLDNPTPEDAKNIKAQVLVLHGAADPLVKPQEVIAFQKEMKDAGVKYRLIKYPGAQHGFTNPANTGSIPGVLYDANADHASWKEMRRLFSQVL